MKLEDRLVKFGILQHAAVEDAEGYDGGWLLNAVQKMQAEMDTALADAVAERDALRAVVGRCRNSAEKWSRKAEDHRNEWGDEDDAEAYVYDDCAVDLLQALYPPKAPK